MIIIVITISRCSVIIIIINYIVNVIIINDYFHDYTVFYTSFEKAILCGFNPIPTCSEFIKCISCIYYNYFIYYILLVSICLVGICLCPTIYQPLDATMNKYICEDWNNIFHTLVVQDHPSIWKLIETLQAECAPVTGVPFKIEVVLDP